MNNKKVKNCSSKSKISNGNKNNKYDLFQLQSLLEELKNKDEEYNLIIKGLKDRIFETKKENNILLREINELKQNNFKLYRNNKDILDENQTDTKLKKNNSQFKENKNELNKIKIIDKQKDEIDKSQTIKKNLINTQTLINKYKEKMFNLENVLNYTDSQIKNQTEDMKKFISEL